MRVEKSVSTLTATVYCGLLNSETGVEHSFQEAIKRVRAITDRGGVCVSITKVTFSYRGWDENGIAIGFINYPRFPEEAESIRKKAIDLGWELKDSLTQKRVSVVFAADTVMLSEEEQ